MNKTQKIILSDDNLDQDKYIFIKLEQDIKTLEVLSLKIDQKDIYQSTNSNFGTIVGRVISNNGIGVPNAKLSIFIPLSDTDALNSDINSIYPYTSPTDKNTEGKRYNLLPRTASFNSETGTYKPKQPFGSFPIKEEIITNDILLNVYKNYYHYTCLTNEYGDYMMYAPIGNQTIHLSCDILDCGIQSMTVQSMINSLGYSPNLFTNGILVKSSNDLNDLPNIEIQDLAINVIPFWGDSSNSGFDIGFTRQDFKIKSKIEQSFILFGTSITYGRLSVIGSPYSGHNPSFDRGFYISGEDQKYTYDIRTCRAAAPNIRVFSFTTNTPIDDITGTTMSSYGKIDFAKQVYEIPKETYYEYNQDGDFVLSIPCNRTKKITDSFGNQTIVDDNSAFGSFSEFYGMIVFENPDLPIDINYTQAFSVDNTAEIAKGWLKVPQTSGLLQEDLDGGAPYSNYFWRKEHFKFQGSKIYSIAQFLPTRYFGYESTAIYSLPNSVNRLDQDITNTGGFFFRVGGRNLVNQTDIDKLNYVSGGDPSTTGSTFTYDMPANAHDSVSGDYIFGAQWINTALIFPNFVCSGGNSDPARVQIAADLIFEQYYNTGNNYFMRDNDELIFGTLKNSRNLLTGIAVETAIIEIPSTEIAKLRVAPKGINVTIYNQGLSDSTLKINPDNYKYRKPAIIYDNRGYSQAAYDYNYDNNNYHSSFTGKTNLTAFIFKGMFLNNNVEKLNNLIL
jgi:hypothetical protein